MFTAIIIVMAITPLGFLKISAVEISLLMIPVALGAIILGPTAGAFFGVVFGLASFAQCFGFSPFGVMLLSINPYSTFVLCLAPRIAAGYLCGLSFYLLKKTKLKDFFTCSLTGALAAVSNTVLFFIIIVLLFGTSSEIVAIMNSFGVENFFTFFIAFVGANGLFEAIISLILVGTIGKFILPTVNKGLKD